MAKANVVIELTPFEEMQKSLEVKYPFLINMRGKYHKSQEQREKISQSLSGRPVSEEGKLQRSKTQKGRAPWNKGKHLSEEDKLHKSLAHKGKPHNAKWNMKVGRAQKGKYISPEQRKNMSLAYIGKTLPPEQREKIRIKSKEMWEDPGRRGKIIKAMEACMEDSETKEERYKKVSESLNGFWTTATQEVRNERSEVTKKGYTEEVKEGMSTSQKERYENQENREKTSEVMKQVWLHLTPEEQSKKISKMRSGCSNVKPTIPEQKVQALLNYCCPNLFMYTGDGTIVINRLIPDFTDCDGSKKVIEVFGEYWHGLKRTGRTKEEEERRKKEAFAKFGFNCLVIWEAELVDSNHENMIEKIKEFSKER